MSGFACMYFQEPSMLGFQERLEQAYQQNNLRTLFGVQDLPKTNALKEVLDEQDSKRFQPGFQGHRATASTKQATRFHSNWLTV